MQWKESSSCRVQIQLFPSSLLLHLRALGMCCCPRSLPLLPGTISDSPPYPPSGSPRRKIPLFGLGNLTFPVLHHPQPHPAWPAHKEPLYSCLAHSCSSPGQEARAVWQEWALPNNMFFFFPPCAVRGCFCSQLCRWEKKNRGFFLGMLGKFFGSCLGAITVQILHLEVMSTAQGCSSPSCSLGRQCPSCSLSSTLGWAQGSWQAPGGCLMC